MSENELTQNICRWAIAIGVSCLALLLFVGLAHAVMGFWHEWISK